MALPFTGNWACKVIRQQMAAGASAEETAALLATMPQFITAIQSGMENDNPGVPGGDGSEHAVANLVNALQEFAS